MPETAHQNKTGFYEVRGTPETLFIFRQMLYRSAAVLSLLETLLTKIPASDAKQSRTETVEEFLKSAVLVFPSAEILKQDIQNLTGAAQASDMSPAENRAVTKADEDKTVH